MSRLPMFYKSLAPLIVVGVVAMSGCTESFTCWGRAKSDVDVTIPSGAAGPEAGDGGETAAVAGYGNLSGRVTLTGTTPGLSSPAAGKVKPADADVCVVDKIPNERLVVNDGGIANVFIYLQKAPNGTKAPEGVEPAAVVMDHQSCTFVPHALVVQAGNPIRVLNADPLVHNVHTKPTRNGSFNSGIGASDRNGIELLYKNGERTPVEVVCDYHAWMKAYHLPLDHPYGAVTDAQGNFSIQGLPAGKHKFTVWHEGNTIGTADVEITPDGDATLNLAYSAGDLKVTQTEPAAMKTIVLASGL
ncbi:MAG: hypothetical protein R3B90_10470 [Planctomycetaceae bacterium]